MNSLVKLFKIISIIVLTAGGLLFSASSHSIENKKLCVWDPSGASGPIMALMSDTKVKAIKWGVNLGFLPYTDEKVAVNDFKAGICDAVFLTALQANDFVPFAASLNAVGGIKSPSELEMLLASLSSPKAESVLTHNNFEVTAIFPIGSVYFFLGDRSDTSPKNLSGNKFSVLNGDISARKFAELVGGIAVPTTLATWAGMFNNGNIDVLGAPALAYDAFELQKGLGDRGGIVDYRLQYALMQVIIRKDSFPAGFGNNMRQHSFNRFDEMQKMVEIAEKNIPDKYWIKLDKETEAEYDRMARYVRLALRDENLYDKKALRLQWKIRCKSAPSNGECAEAE